MGFRVCQGLSQGLAARPHAAGVAIYTWSEDMVRNGWAGDDGRPETALWRRIAFELVDPLQVALGKSVVQLRIPVSFWSYADENDGRRKFVAATANMVNCVVDGATLYMTDPGNAYFTGVVNATFQQQAPEYQPQFIADEKAWNIYHVYHGELHCGSNAKRTFPAGNWWEYAEFINWGTAQP